MQEWVRDMKTRGQRAATTADKVTVRGDVNLHRANVVGGRSRGDLQLDRLYEAAEVRRQAFSAMLDRICHREP